MRLLFPIVKKLDRNIGEEVFAIPSVFQGLPAVLTPPAILSCLGSIDKDFTRSGGSYSVNGGLPSEQVNTPGTLPSPCPLLSSSSPDLTTTTYECFSLSSPPPLLQLTKLLSFLGWISIGGFLLFSLPHLWPSSHPVSTLQPELYFKDANQIV